MQAKYTSLKDFGYTFLGPILSAFLQQFHSANSGSIPVCVAREGWGLHYIINRLQNEGFLRQIGKPIYLRVSRSLLFRVLLGDIDQWAYFFGRSSYSGTVQGLLVSRFGMTADEASAYISDELLGKQLILPRDAEMLENALKPYASDLRSYAKATSVAFRRYVKQLGLTDPNLKFTFLDVGYSGTIQILLTTILNRDTHGQYFITCVPSSNQVGQNHAKIDGVFLSNVSWGCNHLMLERSLLLEALLTAPHGQVRDIRDRHDGSFEFFHGRLSETQFNFQDLSTVFEGAADCVVDMLKHDISFSTEEIGMIFSAFAQPITAIPTEARHLFNIDDDFSGNGLLWPTLLFGI